MNITKNQIKLMQLASQGLLTSFPHKAEKIDVIKTIRKIELLQIDTINVVARSPYFVLWSRIGEYSPNWLDETHAEGLLFEYWAHAACFLPIEQYRIFRPTMKEELPRWKNADVWCENHKDLVNAVRERIKNNGPTKSSDFERKDIKSNGWWDWKEEKIALEYLWSRGELMIAYRDKFQRIYDLTKSVHPEFDQNSISYKEAMEEQVERSIRVLGASKLKWIPDYYRLSKVSVARIVENLLNAKKVIKIYSTDLNEEIYVHQSQMELLDKALSNKLIPNHTTLLNPFDPLIWDRQRTMEIFDFEFSIECYLPATKRKFGYFCLPILYNGNLVGRIDAKAHRKEKFFEIKSIYLENDFKYDLDFFKDLDKSIISCSKWHGTPEIILSKNIPVTIRNLMETHTSQEFFTNEN